METLEELAARVRQIESDLTPLRLLELQVLPGDIIGSRARQYRSALGWYPLSVTNEYKNVSNSSSQFTFYTLTIPKGTLGVNNLVLVELICGFINNSGDVRTLANTVTINGVSHSLLADNIAASATWRPYPYRFLLYGNQSALAQRYWGFQEAFSDSWHGALALNSAAVNIVLQFQQKMSVAHANFQFEFHHARAVVYLSQ